MAMVNRLTTSELAKELGVTKQKIASWRRRGLPGKREGRKVTYSPTEVRQWLIDNKLAVSAGEEIDRTRSECANTFGVSLRTVAAWLTEEGFPGRAGSTGQRNGYFPRKEISEWLKRRAENQMVNQHSVAGPDPMRAELAKLKVEHERIKLAQLSGRMVDVDEVTREVQRISAIAKQMLRNLPDVLVSVLPADTDERLKRDFKRRATVVIDSVCQTIADKILEHE